MELDLTVLETAVLLRLVQLGMDAWKEQPLDEDTAARLDRYPKAAFDGLGRKLGSATDSMMAKVTAAQLLQQQPSRSDD